MKATLILENGRIFRGEAFGYRHDVTAEIVFQTGMTGYQEVLTDPSYYGQAVVMTHPHIGNYGINLDVSQGRTAFASALIVRSRAEATRHYKEEMDLDSFMKYHKVVGLQGIDTRALTKEIREKGTMKALITFSPLSKRQVEERFRRFDLRRHAMATTCSEKYERGTGAHKIAVMDFGIKENILRELEKRNTTMTIFPADTPAKEVLEMNPEGIVLSNGPGDPTDLPDVIEEVKILMEKKPILGICLGHQLLCLAADGKTGKLSFGHHGSNHPVERLEDGKTFITAQNHNYTVVEMPSVMECTYRNLNDDSVEGMKHKTLPVISVQFHPEAGPGPYDAEDVFDAFMTMMEDNHE